MVCTQMMKNELKREWKQPYVSITREMESSFDAPSMYDHVFSWTTIITKV